MNHAKTICPQCGLTYIVRPEQLGRRAKCSACGTLFVINGALEPTSGGVYTVVPEPAAPATLPSAQPTAERPKSTIRPLPAARNSDASPLHPRGLAGHNSASRPCPRCGNSLPASQKVVLCINCGFDFRTSRCVQTELDRGEPREEAEKDGEGEKRVNQAVGAGAFIAVITAIASVVGLFGMGLWNLLDAAIVGGLTYGVYRRSLTCAVLLLVLFVADRMFTWWDAVRVKETASTAQATIVGLFLFAPLFINGVRGLVALRRSPCG